MDRCALWIAAIALVCPKLAEQEAMMLHLHALVVLGFTGIASGGPSPIYHFNAPMGHSLPTESRAPAAPAGIKVPIFKDSDFPYVTIVADDGLDKGGGWQEAKAELEFVKVVIPRSVTKWKCRITIGMPLRTEKMGQIPPSLAATMSSGITNMVMLGMDFDLPREIFCDTFVKGVKVTFKATYPNLGSRVMTW